MRKQPQCQELCDVLVLMQNVKYTHYTLRQLPAILPVLCLLNCAKEQRAGFRLHCSELPTFCPASGLNLLAG